MAKTTKIGKDYYSEGVKVPAPKKDMNASKKKAPIKDAWDREKARKKKWKNMFGGLGK